MLVTVVLNYNDADTVISLVKKIYTYKILDKIIIVDNHSSDDSLETLSMLIDDKVDVLSTDHNGGYGYGNNFGINYAYEKYNADYVLICNPDVEFEELTIHKCLDVFQKNDECAVVAPMMLDAYGNSQYKCVWRIPTFGEYLCFSLPILHHFKKSIYYDEKYISNKEEPVEVGCVAGSLLLTKMSTMRKYGMYDPDIFLYCEETVLGVKLKENGLKTYLVPNYYFYHMHSVSIDKAMKKKIDQQKLMWKSRKIVFRKYYAITRIQSALVELIARINIIETTIIYYIKKFKN